MEKRKNQFVITTICLVAVVLLTGCLAFCTCGMTAKAATADGQESVEPRGIYTQISVALGIDGFGTDEVQVWAEAHNDFTLGFSTIQVYIELFSSLVYMDTCN